ncbi:MAG: hypothetical protein RLZZ623_1542 [Actinomycetota bacterium]|jgi:hypothetical protein
MATVDDVTQLTADLSEVTVGERHGSAAWKVRDRVFAWVRPFSKADIKRFGDTAPPSGPILGVCVVDLEDKQAVLSEGHSGVFTIAHFDGYPALLIQLDVVGIDVLRDLLADAWMVCAPPALVAEFLSRHPLGEPEGE